MAGQKKRVLRKFRVNWESIPKIAEFFLDSFWWNWGGRGRQVKFGEQEVVCNKYSKVAGVGWRLSLFPFMEDGTVVLRSQLQVLIGFEFSRSSCLLTRRYCYSFLFVFPSMGGIPARNSKGERLLLYIGIIDILQSYRWETYQSQSYSGYRLTHLALLDGFVTKFFLKQEQ